MAIGFDDIILMKEVEALEKVAGDFRREARENGFYNILFAHLKYRGKGSRAVIAIYHAWGFFTERELQFIKEFAEKRGMVMEYHESDPGIPWRPSVDIYFPKECGAREEEHAGEVREF